MTEQHADAPRPDDRHALADAETHLVHVLGTSVPPREPGHYELTDAAEDFHAQHGSYDLRGASVDEIEELLARHRK